MWGGDMQQIPKIIHYCWFGHSELPELAQRCIESWREFFPDYEIKEWNETNYDVNKIRYTKEAYEAKKYAFVSDYARFDILYHEGGIYFDTDVEVIRSFDEIIQRGAFMGCEKGDAFSRLKVSPGLGMAAPKGMEIYKEILDEYSRKQFQIDNSEYNMKTVVEYVTEILEKHGLKRSNEVQKIADITIYLKEYFSPKDVDTYELLITENTHSIHHYDASWAEWYDKVAGIRGIKLKKIFGEKLGHRINLIIYVLQKHGFWGCMKKVIKLSR